jgi:hypothetical protein
MLLALGSMSALAGPDTTFKEWIDSGTSSFTDPVAPPPGSGEGVFGSSFYIVNPVGPVEFSFVTSHAGHNLVLSVAFASEGTLSAWEEVFVKTGNSVRSTSYSIDPLTFAYGGVPSGAELIFKIDDKTSGYTYYSGAASNNPDDFAHSVAFYNYYNGKTLVGFEDLYDGGDKDFDDIVFLVSNVSRIPLVPEPETYAMMLAGLGVMGVMVRRRRTSGASLMA